MSQNRPEVIGRTIEETDLWLKELQQEMGLDGADQAYGALRAVLHAIRDRLPPEVAAQMAAQLPLLIAGVFYDGWKPAATPEKIRSPDAFIQNVGKRAGGHDEFTPEKAIAAVFRLLERKMSGPAFDKIAEGLPERIRDLGAAD